MAAEVANSEMRDSQHPEKRVGQLQFVRVLNNLKDFECRKKCRRRKISRGSWRRTRTISRSSSRRFRPTLSSLLSRAKCGTRVGTMKTPMTTSLLNLKRNWACEFNMHSIRKAFSQAKRVTLFEVGPRDGLQNQKKTLPFGQRVTLIQMLAQAGLQNIEVGSFVKPELVPSMRDSDKVIEALKKSSLWGRFNFSCLVPNLKGLQKALQVGVQEIAIFASATQGFSKANLNCTIQQSFAKYQAVVKKALQKGVRVRGYLSMVLGCPYDGEVDPAKVISLAKQLLKMGVYQVSLGDTIGKGNLTTTRALLNQAKGLQDKIALHFHDTNGNAVPNILQSYSNGFTKFDSACGGLGGCPFSRSPKGNVQTEKVVQAFEHLKVQTGVNLQLLKKASLFVKSCLEKND